METAGRKDRFFYLQGFEIYYDNVTVPHIGRDVGQPSTNISYIPGWLLKNPNIEEWRFVRLPSPLPYRKIMFSNPEVDV